MKKWIIVMCAAVLVTGSLCACDREDVDETADMIGDKAETIASEVKDNVDGMISNGQVDDGDGYIGDSDEDTESVTDPTDLVDPTDMPFMDDETEDGGLLDTDYNDIGDHI